MSKGSKPRPIKDRDKFNDATGIKSLVRKNP